MILYSVKLYFIFILFLRCYVRVTCSLKDFAEVTAYTFSPDDQRATRGLIAILLRRLGCTKRARGHLRVALDRLAQKSTGSPPQSLLN